MTDDERLQEIKARCEQVTTWMIADMDLLDTIPWLVEQLEASQQRAADRDSAFSDLCNSLWGLVYPDDPTSWEYPGQTVVHLRQKITELQAENERLRAQNAKLEYVLEQCAPNHPLVVASEGGQP